MLAPGVDPVDKAFDVHVWLMSINNLGRRIGLPGNGLEKVLNDFGLGIICLARISIPSVLQDQSL